MDKLLIIDDDPDLRYIISLQLENENYKLLEADTGSSARSIIDVHKPEIILLDLDLPDIDGVDLFKEIKQNGHLFECIVLSGIKDIQRIVKILKDGVYDYFIKPVEFEKLIVTIRNAREKVFYSKEIMMLRQLEKQSRCQYQHKTMSIVTIMVNNEQILSSSLDKSHDQLLPDKVNKTFQSIKSNNGDNCHWDNSRRVLLYPDNSSKTVQCILRVFNDFNKDERKQLRIAINQGEIIEEGGKIRGDALNNTHKMLEYLSWGEIGISKKVKDENCTDPQLKISENVIHQPDSNLENFELYRINY